MSAVTDPLAVARARQSTFSARESRCRARVSIGRSLHARHVEAISVREEKERDEKRRERERERKREREGERQREKKGGGMRLETRDE